jgi:uncharacterized protein (DUF1499 family)
MPRRRISDAPVSRLAVWARRCAFFSLAATIISIVIVRSGFLEIVPALATFAGALVFAGFSIMLAFGAFAVIWRHGSDGLGYAVMALGIGLALLAYPAYLSIKAYRLPMINDITTDPIDPPRFEVVARLRPRGTVDYAGLYAAEQQRTAYPDVEPLELSANAQAAYDAALQIVTKRKWRIVAERPPQAGRRDGQIEAVARTPIMGFREDVSVRIRPTREGSQIDVRSASRYGKHDLGSNASRIKGLLDDIDDIVTVQQERQERAERRKAQQQKQAPQKGAPPAKKPTS